MGWRQPDAHSGDIYFVNLNPAGVENFGVKVILPKSLCRRSERQNEHNYNQYSRITF